MVFRISREGNQLFKAGTAVIVCVYNDKSGRFDLFKESLGLTKKCTRPWGRALILKMYFRLRFLAGVRLLARC